MQNGLSQLGWTLLIHTAMVGFAFGTDNMPAADWTSVRHFERLVPARVAFVLNYPRDLGDNVATAFDFDPIADLHAQALNLIHVVQCRAAHGRTADGHRFQFRYWREFSGAPNLYMNAFNLSDPSTRGIFVRDRPARSLSCKAKLTMQSGAVHFDYDSINFIGQCLALLLPL